MTSLKRPVPRLRGGIVFVDKLPRDPGGKLILNMDKFDKQAEMVDRNFIRSQPKVKVSPPVKVRVNLITKVKVRGQLGLAR